MNPSWLRNRPGLTSPVPLPSHLLPLLLFLSATYSGGWLAMTAMESLEKTGSGGKQSAQFCLRGLHRAQRDPGEKCQPDTVEKGKEGWGRGRRSSLDPLKRGEGCLSGEGKLG